MVTSMTGFGRAEQHLQVSANEPSYAVTVEIKAVNGRFFKLNIKAPNANSEQEALLESLVKGQVLRGSLTMTVNVRRDGHDTSVTVDEAVALAYADILNRLGISKDVIPLLPGVIKGAKAERDASDAWSLALWNGISNTSKTALDQLLAMRKREGSALADVLRAICVRVHELVSEIRTRAPSVTLEYQTKLHERIAQLLGDSVSVDPHSLAREVALFADRSDIQEELARLESHLQQVKDLLERGSDIGRTLEFLAQELHREANTIGSKSADLQISRAVLQLKGEIERFKEQVANVE